MNIPVVFIHNGNQNYFRMVLEQARKNSREVFVLGQGEFSNTTVNSPDAELFGTLYTHLSTNGHDVELMCFKRWFILRDFMRVSNIKICLHLDSDVLLFTNAEKAYLPFIQFDFTLAHWTSGHSSYWTLQGIEGFCDYLMSTYKDKTYEYDKVSSHYQVRRIHNLPGGTCDMTLLKEYAGKQGGRVGEMMHIFDGWTFDHNINCADQDFVMANGVKSIKFISSAACNNLVPTCMEASGEVIFFNTLHCQDQPKVVSRD